MLNLTDQQLELAVFVGDQYHQQSIDLAKQLQLPLIDTNNQILAECEYPYVLSYSTSGLVLQQTGLKASGPVFVDFASASTQYRHRHGGGELIVKAVGGSKQQRPTVVDATAGLGGDSFVLACWGYTVTALERSPIVSSLLADGLKRAALSDDSELQDIVARLQLKSVDAIDYLSSLALDEKPDVIYMDPMFPSSKKSALVKKNMRAFHYIVGADHDSDTLLEAALDAAKHRVVVKRAKKSNYVANKKPSFSVPGKSIRFDVYGLRAFNK